MKTIKEWFNHLPEDQKEKAIRNTPEKNLEFKETALWRALFVAFNWDDTPEGFEYWKDIYSQIKNQ